MAAFDFPSSPSPGYQVTNPNTGVTYQWDDASSTWQVIGSTAADMYVTDAELQAEASARDAADIALGVRIDNEITDRLAADADLDSRIDTLENAPAPSQLTYQIGTDKVMRAGDPSIELVDSEGYYSNVKFRGTGGISVSSDLQSIIIDGSGIDSGGGDVNLDNYYTKDEIDNQFTLRGAGYTYLVSSFQGTITIRPGEIHTDNRIVGQITAISLGPEDDNGKQRRDAVAGDTIEIYDLVTTKYYRYLINGGSDGTYSVTWQGAEEDRNDPLSMGAPYMVFLYPTHINSANYYDKAASDARYLIATAGQMQDCQRGINFMAACEYTGQVTYANNIANKRYVDTSIAGLASVQYVNDEVDKLATSFSTEDAEPDIHYGDYAPTGERTDGEIWFDSMNLRLNIWSQGAWVNPDRNDGRDLENRITALEARIAQLEGN